MRFYNNKFLRYIKASFVITWIGVAALGIAVATAIITGSFWITVLATIAWLLVAQILYGICLVHMARVEKKRRAKFMLRGDEGALSVTELQSRVIRVVGYDETQATLMVEFRDGRIKYFSPVSKAMYLNLITAPSPGTYYKHHIRPLRKKS